MDAIAASGLLFDELPSRPREIADSQVDVFILIERLTGRSSTARKEGLGDAQQIELVGAGEGVLPVNFCFGGIDTCDKKTAFFQCKDEVINAGRGVFSSEKDLRFRYLPVTGGGCYLIEKKSNTLGVVENGERGFEDVSISITDQGNVFGLRVINGHA